MLKWFTIKDYASAPTTAGVYQYWDKDKILYIGKAINLKARLASHTQNARLDEKERAIVSGATHIKYTETDSEFLALLLEAELIRQYQPPYNRIWKDDKTYLYIVIDTSDPFPRPHFARAHTIKSAKSEIRNKKLKVFGPFPSTQIAEEVLRQVRRLIPFCMSKKIGKRACFYSKIGLCSPCPAIIKTAEQKKLYRHQIFQVIKILSGKIDPVIKDLTRQMKVASIKHDFETALILRTKIERFTRFVVTHSFRENSTISYNTADLKLQSLHELLTTIYQLPTHLHRIEMYDASNSAMHDATVSLVVATDGLLDRGEYRRFKIKNPRANSDFTRLAEALTRRFLPAQAGKNKSWPTPDLIMIDGGTPQLRVIQPILDQLPNPPLLLGLAKRPDRLLGLIPRSQNECKGSTLAVKINLHNPGFQLLIELRDEAHRFANSYRKILQTKRLGAPGRN